MQQILDSFNFSREISFLGLMDLTSQQHRPDNFRFNSIQNYYPERNYDVDGDVMCMVSGLIGHKLPNDHEVRCAHLLKNSSSDALIRLLQVGRETIEDPTRNSLLVAKNIEKLFDKFKISFLPDTSNPVEDGYYVLHVWDHEEANIGIFPTRQIDVLNNPTIMSFNGRRLHYGRLPHILKRALYCQAIFSKFRNNNNMNIQDIDSPLPDSTLACLRSMAMRDPNE